MAPGKPVNKKNTSSKSFNKNKNSKNKTSTSKNNKKNQTDKSGIKKNGTDKVKKPKQKSVMENRREKTIKISNKDVNYSVCISTSILNNCKNLEQITYVLYQVAKSCTLYNVNEVVILKDASGKKASSKKTTTTSTTKDNELKKEMLIATLLQYFVTPPYLVKSVFKKKYWGYFKYCERLPRLTSLPFMRSYYEDKDNSENSTALKGRYREGLSIKMKHPNKEKRNESYSQTKFVNVGEDQVLELKNQLIPYNVRVTIDILEKKVVSPEEAYGDFFGMKSSYGYHIRVVDDFTQIFVNNNTNINYAQTLWINSGDFYFNKESKEYYKIEKNIPKLESIVKKSASETETETDETNDTVPQVLLIFGKWENLSKTFQQNTQSDSSSSIFKDTKLYELFDAELTLPNAVPMGNIRTEDALMIAMTMIQ